MIVSAISATEAPAKTIVLLETKIKLLRVCLRVYITRCIESLTWFGPVVLFAFYQFTATFCVRCTAFRARGNAASLSDPSGKLRVCRITHVRAVVRVYHVSRSRWT